MSKYTNLGGKTLVVDKIEELYPNGGEPKSITRIKNTLSTQISKKEFGELKKDLEAISSDGVITAYEKQGLKREWASLEKAFYSVVESVKKDNTVSSSVEYTELANKIQPEGKFWELEKILIKVFADTTTDYVGTEVKEITGLFVRCWELLSILDKRLQEKANGEYEFSVSIVGSRSVVKSTTLTAKVERYINGVRTEVTGILSSELTWTIYGAKTKTLNGNTINVSVLDMGKDNVPVSLVFKRTLAGYNVFQKTETTLSYGEYKQYSWSNAQKEADLEPNLKWLDTIPQQNAKYLWKRITTDNGATWLYFRDTGIQGEQGPQGIQGEQGPQGIQGEAGKDSNQVVLNFAKNSIAKFVQPWANTEATINNQICKVVATTYLDASKLTWKCSHGVLTQVTNEPYARALAFNTIPLKDRQSLKQVIITVTTVDGHSTNIAVLVEQQEMPTGIYCGVVNAMPPTYNYARPEGVFAIGDFVYFVNSAINKPLASETYRTENIYVFTGLGWGVDNNQEKTFLALQDILKYSGENAPALTVVKQLVANSVVTNNLVVDTANVKGQLDVTRINTTSETGESFSMDTSGLRATSKDGKTSWELKNDGTAVFKNATIDGLMSAKSIQSNPLTTYEQVVGNSLTVPSNLKQMYKADDLINEVKTKLSFNSLRQGMEDVSAQNITLNGEKVLKLGYCDSTATIPDVNNNADKGALKYGKYSSSKLVKAQWTVTTFEGRYNKTGKPLYVRAKTSLKGWSNEAHLSIVSTGYDERFTDANFWLLPDFGIYGQASSTALWGEQTCYTNVDVYYSNGTCPAGWQYINHKDSGSGIWDYEAYIPFESAMTTITIKPYTNYLWFHAAIWEVTCMNNKYDIYLKNGTEKILPIKRVHENSVWFDVSKYKGKTLTLCIAGDMYEPDYQSHEQQYPDEPMPDPYYSYNFKYAYFLEYTTPQYENTYNSAPTSGLLTYSASGCNLIKDGYVYNNNTTRFIDVAHNIDTNNLLSYLPNKSVVDLMKSKGLGKDLKFSQVAPLSYISIDGKRYPSDVNQGLTSLVAYESFFRFYYDNNTAFVDFHYDKTVPNFISRRDDNYSVLVDGYFQALASEEHITTATVLPKNKGIFGIGSVELPYKDIYVGNLLSAKNGYSNLPNGLLMQWGRVEATAHGNNQVNFLIPFVKPPIYIGITNSWTDASARNHSPVVINTSVTNTGFIAYTLGSTNETQHSYWIAIGY